MAVVPELPYEPQQHEICQRANFKRSNGWGPIQYLSPNFLTRFPLGMSSAEMFEGLSWNATTADGGRRTKQAFSLLLDPKRISFKGLAIFAYPLMNLRK